jgi:hypothetical protein
MLAPFILELLIASGLLILVGWTTEAVSASMRNGHGCPDSVLQNGWHAASPVRTTRRYVDSGATWTSGLVPAVTSPRRLASWTTPAVGPVPRRPERRQCRETYS